MRQDPTHSLDSHIRNSQATISTFLPTSDSNRGGGRGGGGGLRGGELETEGTEEVDFHEEGVKKPKKLSTIVGSYNDDDDKAMVTPERENTSIKPPGVVEGEGSSGRIQQSYYDHLELRGTSGSLRFSPTPSVSPESGSRGTTPRPSNYDLLVRKDVSPKPERSLEAVDHVTRSLSSSPDSPRNTATMSLPLSIAYERKVQVVGHTHNYEYIEVDMNGKQGPNSMGGDLNISSPHSETETENPAANELSSSQWVSSWESDGSFMQSRRESQRKKPNTQPRRKQLPLQSVPLNESFGKEEEKARQAQISDSTNIVIESKVEKPKYKPRKNHLPSASSFDLSSSGEAETAKESLSPLRARSNSPPHLQRTNNTVTAGPTPTPRQMSNSIVQAMKEESMAPPTPPKLTYKHKLPSETSTATVNGDTAIPPPPHPTAGRMHSSPSIPPKLNKALAKGFQSLDETSPHPPLPPRPKDLTGFTVSLPVTDFQFEKPLVPPKPRVLAQKPIFRYAAMQFGPEDSSYTEVLPRTRETFDKAGSTWKNDRVIYQSIDFQVTEGLWRTKVAVEDQRNRERQWIEQQQEERMKSIAANGK